VRICLTNSLGNINGIYKSYFRNGHIKEEVNYINGKMNGIYKEYHDNGELWEEKNYINGIHVDNKN